MERKILVAVDGSVYSANTLDYLEGLFGGLADIHLHLLTVVPCGAMPPGKEWLDELDLMSMLSPEASRRFAGAKRAMRDAEKKLARAGMKPEQLSTEVCLSQTTVADDILRKAREGLFDALVIGRRGLGKLEEMFLGSISETVLDKCHDLPVWIVDGQVDSRKFMVPVDGSPETLKAVDHLSFILRDNPFAEITLFHSKAIFAQHPTREVHQFHGTRDPDWCAKHLMRLDSHFHGPQQLLVDSGFPEERIHRLETHVGIYPSRQIVRQALMDGFGTIVMGRRGKDASKGLLGSVSGRVLAMAIDTALWVVG